MNLYRCIVGCLVESTRLAWTPATSCVYSNLPPLRLHLAKLTRLLGSPETWHLTDLPTVSPPQITPFLLALITLLSPSPHLCFHHFVFLLFLLCALRLYASRYIFFFFFCYLSPLPYLLHCYIYFIISFSTPTPSCCHLMLPFPPNLLLPLHLPPLMPSFVGPSLQYLQRRQQENTQRQSRGEPPLPEEDISKLFKPPQAPPRMDTLLIAGTHTHTHTLQHWRLLSPASEDHPHLSSLNSISRLCSAHSSSGSV